jgi:uncharacterized protein YggU (UPF0235/DUF167 family)
MRLTVRVIPRSRRNALEWETGEEEAEGGMLKAHLTAPPVEGAANEALVALLAERLRLPKRAISIVRGATSRQKTLEIADLSAEEVTRRLRENAR